MNKIANMNPFWIRNFFNFKGTEKHVFIENQDRIYQTFTNSNNVAKLDLRKFFLNDPIAFLHRKLEDCYVIFSPYYIKFSKGKFNKKDITSLHKKLQELGLAYQEQQRYIQRQLNFFKLLNEKNKNPANLNNLRVPSS